MAMVRSWVGAAVCALVVLGGCTMPPEPLAELPVHDLDLSVPRNAPPPEPALRPWEQDHDPWAVSKPRAWRYIVIHHSATDNGNAADFDAHHRRRGWDGLGYHFVIDNGRGGPDGRVEVGSRWRLQKAGAHTGGTPRNEYNESGIGICLVGDFTCGMPSEAQLASLHRLVSYLVAHYDIRPENIIGHCDAPGAATECPGTVLHRYIATTLRWRASGAYASRK